MTWRGRRGPVILGPTQDRVASFLERRTRYGRVAIRSVAIADTLGLTRSEVYRITGQLRMLGLFGIEDDRGGTHGGRRYWRTARLHDGAELDQAKHRIAWARIAAWLRRGITRLRAARTVPRRIRAAQPTAGLLAPDPSAGLPATLRAAMRRWAPALADEWRLA